MRLAILLFFAFPALAEGAHNGIAHARTGPELSDLALFAMAAVGVYVARRAMRARTRRD